MDRRVIVDCSWPIGASLNDGIDKFVYQGEKIQLTYPTIDNLARKVFELNMHGSNPIYFFKEDMDRAFRQIYACPRSVPKLGFRWRNLYYFDLVLMMGCRIALYICQHTTNVITYLHGQMGYFLLNYVDDFVGVEFEDKIFSSHAALIRLLRDLGIMRSEKKSVAPTQTIDFVGNLFDVNSMTIGITPECKSAVLKELEVWRTHRMCTCRQLESLIEKLQFMSNCIRPGHLFVSRLLAELKQMSRGKFYYVNNELRKDIKWWYTFLPGYTGTSILWLLDCVEVDSEMVMDACMQQAGAISDKEIFSVKFPNRVKKGAHITHLELWAVILSIKCWGDHFRGKILRIKTDNEAVAQIINTGRSQDLKLQELLRELLWWLTVFQCKVKGAHLPGKINKMSDMLSRWHEGHKV